MHDPDTRGAEQRDCAGERWPFDDLGRSARAVATQTDEPIFLYWGTKWCPPCAEMQVMVLQRPTFRARRARMVAVGVDGDAPGAQACGEHGSTPRSIQP